MQKWEESPQHLRQDFRAESKDSGKVQSMQGMPKGVTYPQQDPSYIQQKICAQLTIIGD